MAEEARPHLPAYRVSPTGTVARVFLHLMGNVGVVPAASTGATVRAMRDSGIRGILEDL